MYMIIFVFTTNIGLFMFSFLSFKKENALDGVVSDILFQNEKQELSRVRPL